MMATVVTLAVAANLNFLAAEIASGAKKAAKALTSNDRSRRTYNIPLQLLAMRTSQKVLCIAGKHFPEGITMDNFQRLTPSQKEQIPLRTLWTRVKDEDPKDNWPFPSKTRAWSDHRGVTHQVKRDQLPPLDNVFEIYLLGEVIMYPTA
jgi:hypothetical protein